MGRPRLFKPERKITLSVAMDISEYDRIYQAARIKGVSMAAFIRDATASHIDRVKSVRQ